MATVTMPELLEDLESEHAALDVLVAPLEDAAWDRPTPAAGWAVRDQISHLAFFDDTATTAMVAPERFTPMAEAALAAAVAGQDPMAEHLARGRSMTGADLLAWWRQARAAMVRAAAALPSGIRVPWFGPPMSPLSFVSARLMETWAHGQDVADALGAPRVPTDRLLHVAHIGVRARPFSYAVRDMTLPDEDVRVELVAPSGAEWSWGDEHAPSSVRGPAVDFCLVVTQRRHLADTRLVVDGAAAREWMAIAQAFAGSPGPGRAPMAER